MKWKWDREKKLTLFCILELTPLSHVGGWCASLQVIRLCKVKSRGGGGEIRNECQGERRKDVKGKECFSRICRDAAKLPLSSRYTRFSLDFLSTHLSPPLSSSCGGLMQWSERRWRDGLRVFCGLMRHSSRAKTISNTPPSPFFFFDLSPSFALVYLLLSQSRYTPHLLCVSLAPSSRVDCLPILPNCIEVNLEASIDRCIMLLVIA